MSKCFMTHYVKINDDKDVTSAIGYKDIAPVHQ